MLPGNGLEDDDDFVVVGGSVFVAAVSVVGEGPFERAAAVFGVV